MIRFISFDDGTYSSSSVKFTVSFLPVTFLLSSVFINLVDGTRLSVGFAGICVSISSCFIRLSSAFDTLPNAELIVSTSKTGISITALEYPVKLISAPSKIISDDNCLLLMDIESSTLPVKAL